MSRRGKSPSGGEGLLERYEAGARRSRFLLALGALLTVGLGAAFAALGATDTSPGDILRALAAAALGAELTTAQQVILRLRLPRIAMAILAGTGLSVSDPPGLLAGSPSVISEWNRDKLLEKLVAYIKDNKIETVVLGYPKNMDGSVGPRAEKCAQLAEDIREQTGVPVVLWDERRTTVEAHQILHQAGKKAKQHRKNVDAVAATLILQGYLDAQRMR